MNNMTTNKYFSFIEEFKNTRIQLASANLQHFFVKALSWC